MMYVLETFYNEKWLWTITDDGLYDAENNDLWSWDQIESAYELGLDEEPNWEVLIESEAFLLIL